MALLTAYYWSLSPIGLPSQPEWLDLEHTWITGLPVHFAVYYLGYVIALCVWHHRLTGISDSDWSTARQASIGVTAAVAIVVVAGFLQALVLREFPGVTWLVCASPCQRFQLGLWSIADGYRPRRWAAASRWASCSYLTADFVVP